MNDHTNRILDYDVAIPYSFTVSKVLYVSNFPHPDGSLATDSSILSRLTDPPTGTYSLPPRSFK